MDSYYEYDALQFQVACPFVSNNFSDKQLQNYLSEVDNVTLLQTLTK